jgi:hypothetical protein
MATINLTVRRKGENRGVRGEERKKERWCKICQCQRTGYVSSVQQQTAAGKHSLIAVWMNAFWNEGSVNLPLILSSKAKGSSLNESIIVAWSGQQKVGRFIFLNCNNLSGVQLRVRSSQPLLPNIGYGCKEGTKYQSWWPPICVWAWQTSEKK